MTEDNKKKAEELGRALKLCLLNVTTASVKKRKQLFDHDLLQCIQNEAFQEGHLKGVSKIVLITLFRYRDTTSRNAVSNFVSMMVKQHKLAAVKYLITEMLSEATQLAKYQPSLLYASSALALLKWCHKICSICLPKKSDNDSLFQQLVEVESLCYSVVCSVSSKRGLRYKKAANLCLDLYKTPEIFLEYLNVIINNERFQIESLCMVGFIFQYLTLKKSVAIVNQIQKKSTIDIIVKNCIQTKIRASKHCLENAKPFLKYLTHEDFAEIVPFLQKGLLRNPETILEAVGLILIGLSINLSKYVKDLSKCIGTHLTTQNAPLRSDALLAIEYLAIQCSDITAVEILLQHLLSILQGSQGKLSQLEQRNAVIMGINQVAKTTVTESSKEKLAVIVFDGLSTFILTEANENVILQGLSTLQTWSEYFVSELPPSFIETIKKGISLKLSTPPIRAKYFQVANQAIKGNTLHQGADLLETLQQSVEKAKNQSHQVISVYECLSASTLIAKMATSDDIQGDKLESFWNSVLDPIKKPLVSEKLLASTQIEHLQQLLEFMTVLFLHHYDVVIEKGITPWYQAFVTLLLHGNWNLQKKTKTVLKKLLAFDNLNGADFQFHLLNDLHSKVVNYKSTKESDDESNKLSVDTLMETYLFIISCGISNLDDNMKTQLLLNCLEKVHHPVIYNTAKNMFQKIASALDIDIKVFLIQQRDEIIDLLMKRDTFEMLHQNLLSTLLSISPEIFLSEFLSQISAFFMDPALSNVTTHEYGIMNTPEGEVYDQSVYESAKAAEKQGNVKRESKNYSYKEQKEEMELREELRKKRGETHKLPELNKNQKEQLHLIVAQEREIRNRLKKLEQTLVKYCILFDACLDVDNVDLTRGYVNYINTLLGFSKSVLPAQHIVPLFVKLSACLFKEDLKHLGEFIAYTNLRHQKPRCSLPQRWCDEKLSLATDRALFYMFTFVTERNVQLMMTYTWKKPFTAPAFAFCLPLLKIILRDRGSIIKHDEQKRMHALQIVMAHAKLRSVSDEKVDENGPELLPRADMLRILSEVIIACDGHNKDGKIQKQANSIFDEVCKASSGLEGCAEATEEELEILVANVLSHCSVLRNASLKGLMEVVPVIKKGINSSMLDLLTRRTMIARYDLVEDNAKLAESLWEVTSLKVTKTLTNELVDDVTHPLADVRLAASLALAAALGEQEELTADVMTKLLEIYQDKLKIPPPVIDSLGRTISAPFVDPWDARQGVGLALEKISVHIDENQLDTLFRFFVPTSLGDRNESVRKQMLDAAMQYVNHFGQDHMSVLLAIFQEFLEQALDTSAHDTIRQSVIILTGSLAKHLAKTDPQIKPIFSKLMSALATPSQPVQQAVANCLPPLCGAVKEDAPELIKTLLNQLLESESYGERRGAAYGLAGLVKGLGILSLKQQNIIATLNESIQDKKVWKHREGALFAFETLCTMLGRLFEPYVVHLLPHLLLCFGDGNQYVREAADETAKAVMKNLSNHGVKLVLPSLLKALEEESWRTKTGSAELLGAMSFCAPKQLSSCLPMIVPRLTEVLADSHLKVQKAGQQALRQIGGVIRNPEIQEISPIILDALSDPNSHTVACLQALLSTSFMHFIDAPSLALIMPTLEKALDQRPMETKKMAAQILGNMYELTDPKDLSPYLPAVVPGLKKSLLDPSPEVRAVSARALGAIVRGMGEDCFNDLMPWLLETITSEISSVDRSGAAQGLAEVLHALGQERLDKLMPDVIATTMKTELSPNVRDGYLMLYIYLPATFGDDFMEYIGDIIPPILKGLADESEYVRDTSLKAGQRIISMYSDSAIELLLPQLEAGLFDEHWRIRYSSVQLLGDLLFRLSGVTGKQTTVGDEDDNFGTAHSAQVILKTLGQERRDRVYAGLYMGRSDIALTVRQAALHVWKVIVPNTAKTLREILPILFELLLSCLACASYDKRQTAARTLGDLVRKLGERILPEIIPILEVGLDNIDGDKRQGVCIGLSEIMNSTSREMISQFEESLISTVRKALVDELAEVRHAASLTFENLHNTIGHRTLDGVLPDVFKKLDDPLLAEYALDGLKQVMAVKSKSVLPFLVPKLTTPPVNTKALAILSSVAGEALVKHLEKILPAMIQAVEASKDGDEVPFEGTRSLILSVEEEVGVRTIVEELMSSTKHQKPGIRKVSGQLLAVFCKETKIDYSQYVQMLFRSIIQLMNDVDDQVAFAGWTALDALVKHLDPAEQLQHLPSLRQAIRFVKDDIRNGQLPGFCILKKGITPVLPIFREGILNGSQEVKEQASSVLGEVIKLTSSDALKPSVIHITGPLIRILGDRFNWNVKVAILDTLGLLLSKVGIMLKPFLPQLQTTFIKALNDQTLAVRSKAAWALGLLTVLHTRVDSLFTELRNGLKNNDDNAIRETILQALRTITLNAGAKMGEVIRNGLLETLLELLDSNKDAIRVYAGAALGALCKLLPQSDMKHLLKDSLLDISQTMDWTICHGRAVALSYALFDAPSKVFEAVDEDEIIDVVIQHSNNDRVPTCTFGVHSLGHLLMFSKEEPDVAPTMIISTMKKNLVSSSVDVRLATLKTIKYVSKTTPEVLQFDRVRYVIPEFISLLRDRNSAVRAQSEITLAFLLQLHKNDVLFDECVSTITEAATILEEYRKNSFEGKLRDTLATEKADYLFIT